MPAPTCCTCLRGGTCARPIHWDESRLLPSRILNSSLPIHLVHSEGSLPNLPPRRSIGPAKGFTSSALHPHPLSSLTQCEAALERARPSLSISTEHGCAAKRSQKTGIYAPAGLPRPVGSRLCRAPSGKGRQRESGNSQFGFASPSLGVSLERSEPVPSGLIAAKPTEIRFPNARRRCLGNARLEAGTP